MDSALACQILLLPAICFGLVVLFDLPALLGIGMLLLAASPGGTTANLFSHLFHGDVALNITLTAINTVIAVVTLPLITGFAIAWFDRQDDVTMPLAEIAKVFALILVVGYVVPKVFGVTGPQAIASSMEVGVHNATLAIFVAVDVLDEVEISVPAAVYSLIMFVFAALWGTWVSRQVAAREVSSVA